MNVVSGFIWNKVDKNNQEYMMGFFTFVDETGKETRVELGIFPNELKMEPSDPDWKVKPKKI